MNRDEFYAAMARHDDARRRKILWTVYWRGNAQFRERIEDELPSQDQPKVSRGRSYQTRPTSWMMPEQLIR